MLLQYCNSIKVGNVNNQNKTIRNIKHDYDFKCLFLLIQWLEKMIVFK